MFDLTTSRRAPVWLSIVVLLSLYPWSVLVNQWFAANGYHRPLYEASGGWLYPNLQVGLPTVVFWLAVFRLGGLRLRDVGWRCRDLAAGALATGGIWLGCHVVAVIVTRDDVRLDGLVATDTSVAVGRLLGQVLGNALYEETLYRGFCLVQLLLIGRARGLGPAAAASLAALGSAVVFALPHIPNRIFKGEYHAWTDVLGDQTMLLCSGLFLAWVYLRTRNLWWAVGLHSLANYPTLLIAWDSPAAAKGTISGLGLLVTLCWPRFVRRTVSGSRGPPRTTLVKADRTRT